MMFRLQCPFIIKTRSLFKKKPESDEEKAKKHDWSEIYCTVCGLTDYHPNGTLPLSFTKCPRCQGVWKRI